MITITSKSNPKFAHLIDLLNGKGLRKHGEAMIFGRRVGDEIVRDFPGRVLGWIVPEGMTAPPSGPGHDLCLAASLFEELDVFGTGEPILLVKIPDIPKVERPHCPTGGVALVIPFQNPDNVGAMIRTGAALGVETIFLTEDAAHPFHPKSVRAAAGAMLRVAMVRLPALAKVEFPWESTVALTAGGNDLRRFAWPRAGILVPGLEGPGLPDQLRARAQVVSIPMRPGVESLNGMVAASIALFSWQTALTPATI